MNRAGQGRATKYLQIQFPFDPKVISKSTAELRRFFLGKLLKIKHFHFAVCMQSSLNGMLKEFNQNILT